MIEENIYKYENQYLEETSAGNIIRGFDSYIKGSATGSGGATGGSRKRAGISDADRVFSRSSSSYFTASAA